MRDNQLFFDTPTFSDLSQIDYYEIVVGYRHTGDNFVKPVEYTEGLQQAAYRVYVKFIAFAELLQRSKKLVYNRSITQIANISEPEFEDYKSFMLNSDIHASEEYALIEYVAVYAVSMSGSRYPIELKKEYKARVEEYARLVYLYTTVGSDNDDGDDNDNNGRESIRTRIDLL